MSSHQQDTELIRLLKGSGEEQSFQNEATFLNAVAGGKVLPDDRIFYSIWTSGVWLSVSEVSLNKQVSWGLDALVSLRLRVRKTPILISILCLLLPLSYLVSLGISEAEAHYFVLGWSHVLLDDHWWAPWTSQFLHGSKGHLFSNLLLLFFLGAQVERALGTWGMLAVLQLGLLGGSLLILFLGNDPVIGASIWLYALWGAVFMIGWRFEEGIPHAQRFGYGWWSFLLFVPVYVLQLHLDALSHLGHLGGLLGGVLAVALLRHGFRVALCSGVGLLLLPFLDSAIPIKVVEHDLLRLQIPSGFQSRVAGQQVVWSSYDFDPAYLQLHVKVDKTANSSFKHTEEIAPLSRRWTRGYYEVLLSCELPMSSQGRADNCAQWISEAELIEPLTIRQLRHQLEQEATPRLKLKLAEGLLEFGSVEEADKIFEELWRRDDAIGFEARKNRVEARMLAPELGLYKEDKMWVVSLVNTTPSTEPLKLWAASYLFANDEQDACRILQLPCTSLEELKLLLEGGSE